MATSARNLHHSRSTGKGDEPEVHEHGRDSVDESTEWWLSAADYYLLDAVRAAGGQLLLADLRPSEPHAITREPARLKDLVERRYVVIDGDLVVLTYTGTKAMETYIRESGMSAEDLRLWDDFTIAQQRLNLVLRRQLLTQSEISPADFEVLRLFLHSSETEMKMNDVVAGLGWEQSRTSHQVSRMIARGLLRNVDPAKSRDKRQRWITPTKAGVETSLRLMPARADLLRRVFFACLTPEDRPVFERVLHTICERAERELG